MPPNGMTGGGSFDVDPRVGRPEPLDPQGGETLWGAGAGLPRAFLQTVDGEAAFVQQARPDLRPVGTGDGTPLPSEPLSEALERRGQDLAAYWVREAQGTTVGVQDREAAYRYQNGMGASQAVEEMHREYGIGYDDAEALVLLETSEFAQVLAHLRQSRDRVVGGGGPLWARQWARSWDTHEAPVELRSLSPAHLLQAFRDVYNSGPQDREGVVNAMASYYPLTRDQIDAILRGAASDTWAVDIIQRGQGENPVLVDSEETSPLSNEEWCGVVSYQLWRTWLRSMPLGDAQRLLEVVYQMPGVVAQNFLKGYEGYDLATFLMSWPDSYLEDLKRALGAPDGPVPTLWEHLEDI